jgi:hypothetical protein
VKLDAYLQSMREEDMALAPADAKKPKKKKEAETKAKAGDKKRKNTSMSSQGVEKLKKTNTAGMPKLSKFFKKVVE